MRRSALLALAGACAALAGAAAATATAQPVDPGTPVPPSTPDFVKAASAADAYEIDAARVAVVEARDARVRAFAERMIADHTRLDRDLLQAASASGAPLPPPMALDDDGSKLLAAVQGVGGPDFDRAYMKQQGLAHQKALDVEGSYAAASSDDALRRAAHAALPVIRHHLAEAQALLASLPPPG